MSLRARVTLAFTAVLAVALVAWAAFLYVRFTADLRETQDRGLRARSAQLVAAVGRGEVSGRLARVPGIEADEDVAQVLAGDGTVVAASALADRPLLTAAQRRAAAASARFADRPGDRALDEDLRLLAVPVAVGAGPGVAVVGASADEVAESTATLLAIEVAGLVAALAIGAAGAWLLAGAVVRPVQSALEREQRLLADAGHELRTPLAVLKSELEVTRMEAGDAAALRAGLASAEEEVDRLSRLADDLLAVARADADGLPLRRERIALDPVLRRAARGFPGVTVDPSGLEITADALQLERAVRNLVDNAARHGAPPVDVHAARRDGVVEITVRDRGPGIPPGFAARAFDPFTRADGGRTRPGAGLGLAIVATVADAHAGRVRLHDGRPGTAVVLTLPVSAPAARSRDSG
jgi:signal transduction histidine kinase